MTLPRRTRRLIDVVVAAVIAIAVVITSAVLWQRSDIRATTSSPAAQSAAPTTPSAPSAAPQQVREIWHLPFDVRYGAVASPYGTVVTADEHTVTGFSATTGEPAWSYSRSNRTLCGIGSGDTTTDALDTWSGIHGIMTVYAKNGYCSQVSLLNPNTGERLYQRTSPTSDPGELFFGSPYVGWLGSDYLELWRHDLVATIRYGDQPNPVNASGPHAGCTFSDAAVTADQLATIEHCGATTNLVLNWPTPDDAPEKGDKSWDANHSVPKATIDLTAADAVIVGITADRAAVVVAKPSPALVVYDSDGSEVSRTDVDISAEEISAAAAAGITPSVTYRSHRYTLVGHHVLSTSATTVTVPAPPPTTTAAPTNGNDAADKTAAAESGSEPSDESSPDTVHKEDVHLDWIAPDALGLPTRVGSEILVPTTAGLAARTVTAGTVTGVIGVNRAGFVGRVDVTAIGDVLVEVRSGADLHLVVALAP